MSFKEKSEWQHKALKFLQIVKDVILMLSLNFQIYNKGLFFSRGCALGIFLVAVS